MRYAIIYLSVPLDNPEHIAPPEEEDAKAIGDLFLAVLKANVPVESIELVGTRLTRNNLVAPAINRIGGS